jgi:amino acid transporter
VGERGDGGLERHFGLVQATALNVTMVIGAGVFITIPYMLLQVPGPLALLGWVAAGALILVDGLIWSELGAALPGSGGSYLYLLECYGRRRWGRLMAFLFIWQFLLSGPLELASGLIAMDAFSQSLSPDWAAFNERWARTFDLWKAEGLDLTFSPGRLGCVAVGGLIIALLYRRVTSLGRLTVVFWLGVLAAAGWILIEGALRFDARKAFDFSGGAAGWDGLGRNLGAAMALALYSYLGYYNVCYIGEEVRDPGRTIPRAVLLSAALVVVLFVAMHLALLGTVSWHDVPKSEAKLKDYSLAAVFMKQAYGGRAWPVALVTLLLMGSCFAAAFSGLLGYSRIPFGAAREGHFFRAVGRAHPRLHIPHVSLLLVGGLTLAWSFFDLTSVISALITTRILAQFIAQVAGVALLRRSQPGLRRPFRLWLYPLPCGLALAGWLYVFVCSRPLYIELGLLTLVAGVAAFFLWSWRTDGWPFAAAEAPSEGR